MKLVVKWVKNEIYSGPALFDEHGQMLPSQTACTVAGEADRDTKITVSFRVDGENVVIEDGPASNEDR